MLNKYSKVIGIALVIISMITIFLFSSENSESSKRTTKKVVEEVSKVVIRNEDNSKNTTKKIESNLTIVRKIGHLTEFFILGFFIINLYYIYTRIVSMKGFIISISASFIYACTDELHQLFVAGRTSSYIDVLIDTIGAFLGIISYILIIKHYQNNKNNLEIVNYNK